MAEQELLDLLKRGVKEWKQWREINAYARPNLSDADLQEERVRCWFAPEQMKIGDKMRHRIDEPILFSDKLLLALSEHSIASTWVQNKVVAAFEKERQRGGQVLFPLALDDTVKYTVQAWVGGDYSAQEAYRRLYLSVPNIL